VKSVLRLILLGVVRLLAGAHAGWQVCAPQPRQRIYYAHHTSHFDTLVIVAALPAELRAETHPVAALELLGSLGVAPVYCRRVLERRSDRPLRPILGGSAAAAGRVSRARAFADPVPERTRGADGTVGRFGSGLYNLAQRFPQAELAPVYLDNPRRVMPKESFLIVPMICTARFGMPLTNLRSERRQGPISRARPRCPPCARRSAAVAGASVRGDEMIANSIFVAVTGGVIGFLALCTVIGVVLARHVGTPAARDTVANLNARIRAWWGIVVVFGSALVFGRLVTLVLFAIISFLSFREFMSLTPTRAGDPARFSCRSLSSCRCNIG
jgi:hypothetical protein